MAECTFLGKLLGNLHYFVCPLRVWVNVCVRVRADMSFCSCHWNKGLFFITCPPLLFFSSSFCLLRASLALQTTFWNEKKAFIMHLCVCISLSNSVVHVCVCCSMSNSCVCVWAGGTVTDADSKDACTLKGWWKKEKKGKCYWNMPVEKKGPITSFPLKTWNGDVRFPLWPWKTSCYDFNEPSGNKQLNDINILEWNWLWFDWQC